MSISETIVSTRYLNNIRKKKIIQALLIVLALLGLWFSYKWITHWRYMLSTEDAYVQGDISAIAPKLNGYIEKIAIKANQIVKKDDILFYLDNGDYQIALDQTEARLNTQKKLFYVLMHKLQQLIAL